MQILDIHRIKFIESICKYANLFTLEIFKIKNIYATSNDYKTTFIFKIITNENMFIFITILNVRPFWTLFRI